MSRAVTRPVVELDHAAAGYGDRLLWSEVDLSIAPGEFVAVLGGNGTGKTTLLRILLGMHPVADGAVRLFGAAPHRGDRRVGYVPQHQAFDREMPARGIDLVNLGARGHRYGVPWRSRSVATRVAGAIEAVGAQAYATAPVGMLSGGEQQRLRIAAAVVDDPQLILADEPLSSLDLASQQQVADVLDAQRRATGAAVVVVTHDINPVRRHVDRVLYLAAGRGVSGTPDQVLTGEQLSALYGTRVDVARVGDHLVIVGAPNEPTGPHHGGAS
jgi:zinc/manganese transport system ATP-binding protein